MSDGWAELAKEAAKLPALLSDIYGDLLRPGVKQVGKALESVLGLGNTVLWPLALINKRADIALEKNLEKYRARLERVPLDEVVQVRPEIGVPIAERLGYVNDERLSDLYINLLVKASVKSTTKFAHPAFVNLINDLSPDEALLIYEIKQSRYSYVRKGRLTKTDIPGGIGEIEESIIQNEFPVSDLSFADLFTMYVEHLAHLNILVTRPVAHMNSTEPGFAETKLELRLTPFGALFCEACCIPHAPLAPAPD